MIKNITTKEVKTIILEETIKLLKEVEAPDGFPFPHIKDGKLIGYTDKEMVDYSAEGGIVTWPPETRYRVEKDGKILIYVLKEEDWDPFESKSADWTFVSETEETSAEETGEGEEDADEGGTEQGDTGDESSQETGEETEAEEETGQEGGQGTEAEAEAEEETEEASSEEETPTPEPEEPEYAKNWTEYAETGEQEAEIARLWTQLTAKGPLQEALEGYTNSFFSYAKFYKDEVAKQMKQGGKSYISPEEMVALLKSKLQEPETKLPAVDKLQAQLKFARDRQAEAEMAYNKVREEFSAIKTRDKEIADKQVALGVPDKLKFKKRKEYNDLNKQRLETLAQLKAKKKEVDQAFEVLKTARTKVVDKSAESAREKTKVNESLISESTFDRWQTLIKN